MTLITYNTPTILLPRTMPMERSMTKGRRRPNLDRHRSLNDPSKGVRKNPIKGLRHQISVMLRC